MRVQIRELEENNVFLENAKRAEVKISKVLQQLSLTPQITHVEKDIDIDDEELTLEDLAVYEAPIEPLLLPVHKESLALRRAINKLTAKVAELEALRVKTADLQEDEDLTLTELVELEKEVSALDEDIAESVTKMNELWINCRKHNIESKYGHYVQLLVGLSELYKALTKFLASNSKRPRGKIEFIFNNAIEFVGGGEYMAEHSGYEQTNGRALNTLKNFADVKALCLSAIDSSDAIFPKAQAMFELFDDLVIHMYALLVHLKSQQRLSVSKTEKLLVSFFEAWDKAFPFVTYINKMHFLMEHVIEFVEEYGVYGRFSAESHESVHARFERIKTAVKRMASTQQRFKTFFARATVDLKDGIVKTKEIVRKKMTGNKRGKYNVIKATKRQDDVNFVSSSIFKDEVVTVDGVEYLDVCVGGRIPAEYKDLYMYVKLGKAPDDWVKCYETTQFLSVAKIEQAKHARH